MVFTHLKTLSTKSPQSIDFFSLSHSLDSPNFHWYCLGWEVKERQVGNHCLLPSSCLSSSTSKQYRSSLSCLLLPIFWWLSLIDLNTGSNLHFFLYDCVMKSHWQRPLVVCILQALANSTVSHNVWSPFTLYVNTIQRLPKIEMCDSPREIWSKENLHVAVNLDNRSFK